MKTKAAKATAKAVTLVKVNPKAEARRRAERIEQARAKVERYTAKLARAKAKVERYTAKLAEWKMRLVHAASRPMGKRAA